MSQKPEETIAELLNAALVPYQRLAQAGQGAVDEIVALRAQAEAKETEAAELATQLEAARAEIAALRKKRPAVMAKGPAPTAKKGARRK